MNRIRYRQWIKTRGDAKELGSYWLLWGYIDNQGFVYPKVDSEFQLVGESFQSTGLRDSKGVEVFEGDIVQFKLWNEEITKPPYLYDKGVVVWNEGTLGYVVEWRGERYTLIGRKATTVIGNTVEHPDLMKEVEK